MRMERRTSIRTLFANPLDARSDLVLAERLARQRDFGEDLEKEKGSETISDPFFVTRRVEHGSRAGRLDAPDTPEVLSRRWESLSTIMGRNERGQ